MDDEEAAPINEIANMYRKIYTGEGGNRLSTGLFQDNFGRR